MSEPVGWHADRRVPIALIFTILMQSGVVIWWAADMSAKVDQIIQTQADDRASIADNRNQVRGLQRNEAAVEERLRSIDASQQRIENSVTEILQYLRSGR